MDFSLTIYGWIHHWRYIDGFIIDDIWMDLSLTIYRWIIIDDIWIDLSLTIYKWIYHWRYKDGFIIDVYQFKLLGPVTNLPCEERKWDVHLCVFNLQLTTCQAINWRVFKGSVIGVSMLWNYPWIRIAGVLECW